MNSFPPILALTASFWTALGSFVLYGLVFLAPLTAAVMLAHKLLSLPLQRRNRARLFLDLIDTAISQGKPLEQTLISVSASRDPSPGVRFHLLAAHLETGLRLSQALERVPRMLPPQLAAMLAAGERLGDVRKVLPACRQLLNDGLSQTRGALNYLLILAFVITPFTVLVPLMLNLVVIPKFKEIFAGMLDGAPLPAFTVFIVSNSRSIVFLYLLVLAVVWFSMIAYVGGPRLTSWIRRILPGFPDRFFVLLPWRHKRLQRDFSSMLAILLESNVPELEAVTLAAQTTANRIFQKRAVRVGARLRDGVRLPEALGAMDDSGELRWRLANTLQHGRHFVRALAGWHEALDAKAFQQEQAAAQLVTTGLVLLNGVLVASVVGAIFLALTDLIMKAALW